MGNSHSFHHDELVEARVDADVGPMLTTDRRPELKVHSKWNCGDTRSERERKNAGPNRKRGGPAKAGHVIIVVVRVSSSLKSGGESHSVDQVSESGSSQAGHQSSGLRVMGAPLEAAMRTRRCAVEGGAESSS